MYVKDEKYAPAVLKRFGIAHNSEDIGEGRKVLWILDIGCGGKPISLKICKAELQAHILLTFLVYSILNTRGSTAA